MILVPALAFTLAAKPLVLYVASFGNDAWTGKYPDQRGRQGPMKTLDAARLRVRRLKDGKRPIRVVFLPSGKEVAFDKPLVFTPEDSGTAGAPITYTSGKERTTFTGMQRLTGFERTGDGLWRLVLHNKLALGQLFVNGQRRLFARLPLHGYFKVEASVVPTPESATKGHDRFQYQAGDVDPGWVEQDSAEFVMFHNWSVSRLRPKDIDPGLRTVTFKSPTCGLNDWSSLRPGDRYIVENVSAGLRPGTWCFNRRSGELLYDPLPGESLSTSRIETPRLKELLEFRGDPEHQKWVEHISVQGLNFRGTDSTLEGSGRSFPQAEADLTGAIRLRGARHCRLWATDVYESGEYAVDVGGSCQEITVKNCNFEDLGAGGVKVGVTPFVEDPEQQTGHVTVEGCVISGGGRVHPAAVGVWIGSSAHNTIKDNWIQDLYYTGVSVGWSWGYGESGAHHNVISGNTIKDIGQGVLSDMGGVYLLGIAPGTIVRGNRISNVRSFSYGGWGLYTDEGSTGVVLENNLVCGTKSAGFHQHYGKENTVRNNVFAFGEEHQVMRTRAEEHLSFTFERNIVVFSNGNLLGSNWDGKGFVMKNNIYWRSGGSSFDFAGKSWDEWRAGGQDPGSLIADPLFVDPNRGDFRLRTASPAKKTGFVPFGALKPSKAPWLRYPSLLPGWPTVPFPARG